MPRHWQVLILAALGIGATLVAVPRALSGIAAVPQGGTDPAISRTGAPTTSPKANAATVPAFSASGSTSPTPDTKAPTTVANLRVVSVSDTGAVITWDASSDNVAVKTYIVRSDATSPVQTAPPATLGWARRSSSVTIQVAAVDTSGNQSEWRSITVNPKTAAVSQPVTTVPAGSSSAPPPPPSTPPVVVESTPTSSAPASEAVTPTSGDTAAGAPVQSGAAPADQSNPPA